MKITRLLLVLVIVSIATTAFAWGPEGHKIVAEIAKTYLSKNTLDSVQKYLGITSFEEASVWMDEMKSKPNYDYMKPWHYVNVEKDKTYVKTSDGNVISVLETIIAQLKNRKKQTDTETAIHLKILFHLVGDMHQPLHVGYGSDRGGNDVKVKFLKKQSNLHRVWDEDIIVDKNITLESCLALASQLTPEEKKEAQKVNIMKWMEEGRALLPQVYDIKDESIQQDYIDKNALVIEKQLLLGGMHLAAVLNDVFKK